MSNDTSFSALVASAFDLFQQRRKEVLVSAIFFTIFMALPKDLLKELSFAPTTMGLTILLASLLIIGMVAWFFLAFLYTAYYYVLFIQQPASYKIAIKSAARLVFPMIGIGFLVFFQSFAFVSVLSIPFFIIGNVYYGIGVLFLLAGMIAAFIQVPRYFLAAILVAGGAKSIHTAMKDSYAKTEGYWGKIFGNNLLLMLGIMILNAMVGGIAGIMVLITHGALLSTILIDYVSIVFGAFITAFQVKLAAAIIANPRMKTAVIKS